MYGPNRIGLKGHPCRQPDLKSPVLSWTTRYMLLVALKTVVALLPEVEFYNPIANNWTVVAPLPQPLDHTAAASYNGKLYVVGGGYLDRNTLSNKLFVYDPNANQWTQGANLPAARGALTANFINGTLYVVGGVDPEKTLASTLAYDPDTDKWTEKAPMPTTQGTSYICSCQWKIIRYRRKKQWDVL